MKEAWEGCHSIRVTSLRPSPGKVFAEKRERERERERKRHKASVFIPHILPFQPHVRASATAYG